MIRDDLFAGRMLWPRYCEFPGCTNAPIRKDRVCIEHGAKPPSLPPPEDGDADWSFLGPRDLGRYS